MECPEIQRVDREVVSEVDAYARCVRIRWWVGYFEPPFVCISTRLKKKRFCYKGVIHSPPIATRWLLSILLMYALIVSAHALMVDPVVSHAEDAVPVDPEQLLGS